MLKRKLEQLARDGLRAINNNVPSTESALVTYSDKITVKFVYNGAHCEALFREDSLKYIRWETTKAIGEIHYER